MRAKDQFFSIIGHDLKSPFNNIIGFVSLLSDEDVELAPEKTREYAALIVESAQNTNALLDTLLACSSGMAATFGSTLNKVRAAPFTSHYQGAKASLPLTTKRRI